MLGYGSYNGRCTPNHPLRVNLHVTRVFFVLLEGRQR